MDMLRRSINCRIIVIITDSIEEIRQLTYSVRGDGSYRRSELRRRRRRANWRRARRELWRKTAATLMLCSGCGGSWQRRRAPRELPAPTAAVTETRFSRESVPLSPPSETYVFQKVRSAWVAYSDAIRGSLTAYRLKWIVITFIISL